MIRRTRKTFFHGTACLLVALLLSLRASAAQTDVDREFEYASKLVEMDLPGYAELVVKEILRDHPDQKERANLIKLEALVKQRQLKQAEALLAEMPQDSPKTQAGQLHIARAAYSLGEKEKSAKLYQSFFNLYTNRIPTDSDLLRIYQEAAREFGMMLAQDQHYGRAAEIYDLALQASPPKEAVRQIEAEQAEFLLRAAREEEGKERTQKLEKAEKICNQIIWGGKDLWFGRAITCMAQIYAMRNRKDDAIELLRSNRQMLKKLDELLQEADIPVSQSPYAGTRALLGSLYKEEADILTGPPGPREKEALSYFDRALDELGGVWRFVQRQMARDKAVVERLGQDRLEGSRTERMQPFETLTTVLRELQGYLQQGVGQSWSKESAKQVEELQKKTSDLLQKIADQPKDIGVTPTEEMELAEDSLARKSITRGLVFLADERARREKAVQLYVQALKAYYNVFLNYPGSDWHREAGVEVEKIKETLQALTGQEIEVGTKTGGEEKLGKVQFKEADNLFGRDQYAKAVELYLNGLSKAPEGDPAFFALAKLVESYSRMGDELRVKAVARYIAERFKNHGETPRVLLRLGSYYFGEKNRPMYADVYELYLKNFPDDQQAPVILYSLGEQRWKVEDYAGAVPYYQRIVDNYRDTLQFTKALYRIGWSYYLREDYEQAAKAFARLAEEANPSKQKAEGKLLLADSLMNLNEYAKALQHFSELTKWLVERDSHYTRSERARNEFQPMLERAVFLQAYCLSRIDQPADKVPAYREAAANLYRNFVKRFPTSDSAPQALSSLGAVLLSQGKSEEAAQVYDQLAKDYPDSPAGQNARLAMIQSLARIGQLSRAQAELDKMIADAGSYPVTDFFRVGQLMLEEKAYEPAVKAFEQALGMLKGKSDMTDAERAVDQQSLLGAARAYYALKEFKEAAAKAERLAADYPQSALFYETRFLLARAYKEEGRPAEAIGILKDVFERAEDQQLIREATMELAEMQAAEGNLDEALASYRRIVLLADPDDPKVRSIYEKALAQSVRLFTETERWREAVEAAETYIAEFPSGESIVDVRRWRSTAMMQISLGQ